MAWIKVVEDGEAAGLLARIFQEARARAGRVWNILRIQSRRPEQLEASLNLYREIMFGRSALTRAEREMLAVVVSRTNGCRY